MLIQFLKTLSKKHSLAVTEFATHLNKYEAQNFEFAWTTYYGVDKQSLDEDDMIDGEPPAEWRAHRFLQKYSKNDVGTGKTQKRRELAITNIKNLLAFSKYPNRVVTAV